MAKSKEELDAIRSEYGALKEKLQELTPEELEEVAGGYEYIGNFKYSLNKGDCFRERRFIYKVKYDYPAISFEKSSHIFCDQYAEAAPGEYHFESADCTFDIRNLKNLEYVGIDFV